jgi:hypothetical protein
MNTIYISCNIHYETCRNNIGNINTKLLQHISERPIFKTLMLNYCNIGWSVQFFLKSRMSVLYHYRFLNLCCHNICRCHCTVTAAKTQRTYATTTKLRRVHTAQDGRKLGKHPRVHAASRVEIEHREANKRCPGAHLNEPFYMSNRMPWHT